MKLFPYALAAGLAAASANAPALAADITGAGATFPFPVYSKWAEAYRKEAGIGRPITGATFILVYKTPDKPEQVAEVLKFFDWAYKSGDKLASDLDYVPLPDKASDQVRQVWSKEIKGKDGKPLFAAKGS